MANQDCHADDLEQFWRALGPNREQHGKGNKPVQDKVQGKKVEPGSIRAFHKVCDFVRYIAVPNQQVLAGPDVGPENGEGEHHFAQIVELVLANYFGERATLLQEDDRQRNGGYSLDKCSGEFIEAEHGAGPLRIQREQPVISAKREGEREGQDKEHRIAGKTMMQNQALARIAVLLK